MNGAGFCEYPLAYRAALDIHEKNTWAFPLNVSRLLEHIETHRIYDVSSHIYNSLVATGGDARLCPRRAWTVYNEQLDVHLIVWNHARPPAEIRFSVAHEIGHILLNHERAWPTDAALNKRQKEAAANVFARSLLAPFDEIYKLCHPAPYSIGRVADHFGIPCPVAKGLKAEYACWLARRPLTYGGNTFFPSAGAGRPVPFCSPSLRP